MSRYLLTTILGLEEALAKEASMRNARVLATLPSRVVVEGPPPEARTAARILRIHAMKRVDVFSVKDVRLGIREVFREHALKGSRIESHVHGGCLSVKMLKAVAVREYKRVYGEDPPKKGGRTIIDLFCRKKIMVVSTDYRALWSGSRPYYFGGHPASLNPLIAAAIPFIADTFGETLLDPMCGSGTIPIEASLATGGRSLASDIVEKYARLAAEQSSLAGAQVDVFVADVSKHPIRGVDVVATDPPRHDKGLHASLVKRLVSIEPGKIVLVTPFPGLAGRLMLGFRLCKRVRTFQGGEKVYIEVYKRDPSI